MHAGPYARRVRRRPRISDQGCKSLLPIPPSLGGFCEIRYGLVWTAPLCAYPYHWYADVFESADPGGRAAGTTPLLNGRRKRAEKRKTMS